MASYTLSATSGCPNHAYKTFIDRFLNLKKNLKKLNYVHFKSIRLPLLSMAPFMYNTK